MTDDNLDPFRLAERDTRQWTAALKVRAVDIFRKYTTATVVKLVVGTVLSAIVAAVVLPWIAGAVAAISITALAVAVVYTTKLLKAKDSDLRWQTIHNVRLKQQVLELEDAGDRAAVALIEGRSQLTKVRPIELRQSVWYLQSAYRIEQANAQVPAILQRQASQPPDLSSVKRRISGRVDKIAEGEARVQSLCVPEAVDLLIAAKEAARTREQRQSAALAADRAARQNRRQGKTPSPASAGLAFRVESTAGRPAVTEIQPQLTPEQIACGETRTPPAAAGEAA
jgi:hypothetical protein